MQTILGSTGVIGTSLAKSLVGFVDHVRLVSRSPRPVNDGDEIYSADLLDPVQCTAAVQGATVVYLTAGLPYKLSVWKEQWPVLINNVLNACREHGARLVFFDNVYTYGAVKGAMTEESPVKPTSEKGKVRAQVADAVLEASARNDLDAMIVRAADFYGKSPLSVASVMILDKLANGKRAQWMVSDSFLHTFAYIPDMGKATALLGNTPSAYNQVWHLPVDPNTLTVSEFIELAASKFNAKPGCTVLSERMLKVVGFFMPVVKEGIEMLYQNDRDYVLDSSKFDTAFEFPTCSYTEGLTETAAQYKNS